MCKTILFLVRTNAPSGLWEYLSMLVGVCLWCFTVDFKSCFLFQNLFYIYINCRKSAILL